MSVRLLPMALAAIVAATAMPVEFRSGPALFWDPGVADFLMNVLLYLPVGATLVRRKFGAVVLTALILSASIEALQLWYFQRYASLFDLLANVVGAASGWLVATHSLRAGLVPPVAIDIDRRAAAVAGVIAVALLLAWNLFRIPVDLSTWDDSFELRVKNEKTLDRPWQGDIASVLLLAETIEERDSRGVFEGLGLPPGLHLVTRAARVASADLRSAEAGLRPAENEVARRFYATAVGAAAFTVIARLRPENVAQRGPARIVTFSIDPFRRNFDLGQEGRRLVFRVRTPATNQNGMWPHVVTEPALTDARYVTIVAAFDGAVSRVYLDGFLRGRANVEAAGCLLPTLCDTDLPTGAAVLGMTLAVLLLFAAGSVSRPARLGVSLVGGLAAAALALAPFAWVAPAVAASVGLAALLGAAAVWLGADQPLSPADEVL